MHIDDVTPSIFFRKTTGGLEQRVQVTIENDGAPETGVYSITLKARPDEVLKQTELDSITLKAHPEEVLKQTELDSITLKARPDEVLKQTELDILTGRHFYDVFIPEISEVFDAELNIVFKNGENLSWPFVLKPQRKWVVHVVQLSHHDPGYTDLPSFAIEDHCRWLDEAIDHAESTADYPDDAKFRIVIEQAWSIDTFLKHMPRERTDKMIALMQEGRVEITALFGNMTSELMGHEAMARSVYHAFALKRKYHVPIVSAEHNDITGIAWGMSRVLTDAGVKLFAPGIPLYYSWDKNKKMASFWDQEKIFGRKGPGAFWWEAPNAKKLLFWCNNTGCGGPNHGQVADIPEYLTQIQEQGYPWSVLRWPVGGGARDNAPYIRTYADNIKKWQEEWAFPRFICSTNAAFAEDIFQEDLSELPVWRGEIPGQDYPSGATSTAVATAVNRNAEAMLIAAEKLSSAAALHTDLAYPKQRLQEAAEENLWHDEHAWGFHFPAGPAMQASRMEKGLHAYRAQAIVHGVLNKAMARIADSMQLSSHPHLVVFNTAPAMASGLVCAVMRELDNSGSEMAWTPAEKNTEPYGYLKGYVLGHRFHLNLSEEILNGHFHLRSLENNTIIPFEIKMFEDPMTPVPYSEDRLGLGNGTRRYGMFEMPHGIKKDLCFFARDIPALGWQTYQLEEIATTSSDVCQSHETGSDTDNSGSSSGAGKKERVQEIGMQENGHNQCNTATTKNSLSFCIENAFYRITASLAQGIESVWDVEAQRELVQPDAEHGFFQMVVRQGADLACSLDVYQDVKRSQNTVFSSLSFTSQAPAHPIITKEVLLVHGLKKIFLNVKILKDATPMTNAHIAFPFFAKKPQFRYESGLSVERPVTDFLPGGFSDTLSVQNWVKVQDETFHILWSSLDAPITGFSKLWPGYVSPAHRGIVHDETFHSPQNEDALNTGAIYSQLFNNNFGTNFYVTQPGISLFRYVITTSATDVSDAQAAQFGWSSAMPFSSILTDRVKENGLPGSGSFLSIDNPHILVLNWKMAEDENGYIVRLWNMDDKAQEGLLHFLGQTPLSAYLTTIAEENASPLQIQGQCILLQLSPDTVETVRVMFS